MKILREIIDYCTSKRQATPTSGTPESFHIEDVELDRRDFETVVSAGAIAVPVLVSEVPLAKAVEVASSLFARVGVGAGEASLLKGALEWGLSQFTPEFTLEYPNEKKGVRISTSKSLLRGVSERDKDFPITELLQLKDSLPILRRAAQGEKIFPDRRSDQHQNR